MFVCAFCYQILSDLFLKGEFYVYLFTGVQYAESVLNFSRNCDYAMYVVDHLLDILTGNEHRKTSKYIEEMKNLRKGNCNFWNIETVTKKMTQEPKYVTLKNPQFWPFFDETLSNRLSHE